jgi:hypothetical protein
MADFTIITDTETGEILGGAHGHVGHEPGQPDQQAGLIAGPGQKVEHVDIPDHLVDVEDADEFHAKLKEHLGK